MKKIFFLLFILFQTFLALSYGEPMESFKNYNVILVHGAGGRYFGMDCDNDSKIDGASGSLSKLDSASGREAQEVRAYGW